VRAAGASPTSAQLPRTTSARESPAQARNQGLTLTTLMPEGPKVLRRPADGLAYAWAIAERHGLTYERLVERIAE
jgi:hypothetical protein